MIAYDRRARFIGNNGHERRFGAAIALIRQKIRNNRGSNGGGGGGGGGSGALSLKRIAACNQPGN